MIFTGTAVEGSFLLDLEPHRDERGFFARTFCAEEFRRHGLEPAVAQRSVSVSTRRGTLRGLHYQRAPYGEAKLVSCVRGGICDIVVDLRKDSPTFLAHVTAELTAANRRALYVPPGCAHGFQALEDDTEVHYQMSTPYVPEAQDGVRWDDPAFGLQWPIAGPFMSERDRSWPDFEVP